MEAFDEEPTNRKPIYTPKGTGIAVLPPGSRAPVSLDEVDRSPYYEDAVPVAYPRGNRGPRFPTQGPPPPDHPPPPAPSKRSKKKKQKQKEPDTGPGVADIYGSTHSLSRMAGLDGDTSDPTIGTRGYTQANVWAGRKS